MSENKRDTSTAQSNAARYEMRKSVERKDDGRLLIYYTFVPKAAGAQEAAVDNTTKANQKEKTQP